MRCLGHWNQRTFLCIVRENLHYEFIEKRDALDKIYEETPAEKKVACVAGEIRERASSGRVAILPRGQSPRGISRAAKPRVKFPPATFCTVFACHPLLSLLMNQLNKPVRERNVTRNLGLFLSETVQMHATHRK